MLVLLTRAFAEDIPAGAQVVVAHGAPIYDLHGEQPSVPLSPKGWSAVVEKDLGERLDVRMLTVGCVAPLDVAMQLSDVHFLVDEKSLLPLLQEDLHGKTKEGLVWSVGKGTPVLREKDGTLALPFEGVEILVPAEGALQGRYLPKDTPFGHFLESGRLGKIEPISGIVADFMGQPLAHERGIWVNEGPDGFAIWTGDCAQLPILPPRPVCWSDALVGIGELGSRVRTFAVPVTLADGTPMGEVPWLDNFTEPVTVYGDHSCMVYHFRDQKGKEGPTMNLCLPTRAVEAKVDDPVNMVVLGALDKEKIDAGVRRNMSSLRRCYAQGLKSNPTLAGRVVIKFTIAADGSVSQAAVKSSSMNHPETENCMVAAVRTFHFPEPTGGGVVIVSYPFSFSPG